MPALSCSWRHSLPSRRDRARAALRRDEQLARRITPIYRRTFRTELEYLLDNLVAGGDPADLITDDFFEDAVGEAWVLVGRAVYDQTYITLTADLPETRAAPTQELSGLIRQIISGGRPITHVRQMITDESAGISVRSRRLIRTALRDADLRQLRDVTKALRSLYTTDFVKTRAGRMALNSALRSSIVFENEAAKSAQERLRRFKYVKIWTTVGDGAVRPWHMDADGQQRDLDDLFDVGGELLQYPRDGAGSPGNTYNCRCWVEHQRVRINARTGSV